jgi:hypothetical protein
MDGQELLTITSFFQPRLSCVLKFTKEGRTELVYTQHVWIKCSGLFDIQFTVRLFQSNCRLPDIKFTVRLFQSNCRLPDIQFTVRLFQSNCRLPDIQFTLGLFQSNCRLPDIQFTVRLFQSNCRLPDIQFTVRLFQSNCRLPDIQFTVWMFQSNCSCKLARLPLCVYVCVRVKLLNSYNCYHQCSNYFTAFLSAHKVQNCLKLCIFRDCIMILKHVRSFNVEFYKGVTILDHKTEVA